MPRWDNRSTPKKQSWVSHGVNYRISIEEVFMNKFYYVYVLLSEKDHSFYIGFTIDIKTRLTEHNSGKVSTTRNRRPLKLVYWEGCLNQQDTAKREKYLKTTWGKRYIKSRLKEYLTGQERYL
jgi:putative endonuclease